MILHFNKRDFTAIDTSKGKVGVYRTHLSSGGVGRWTPHAGLVHCPGKEIPLIPDTRAFWNGKIPGYQTEAIFEACQQLDKESLPKGKEASPEEVNLLADPVQGRESNRTLELINRVRMATERLPLPGKGAKIERPQKDPLLSAAVRLCRLRLCGHIGPAVRGGALALAMVVLAAAAPTARGDSGLRPHMQEAYTAIQKLDGPELKALLEKIPPAARKELVALLPDRLMPPFIPRSIAATNISLAPASEIKKNFQKMTEAEFVEAGEKAGGDTVRKLLALLKTTLGKTETQPSLPQG